MTSLADRSRVPAGVRTGGQFATEARAESDISLALAPHQDLPPVDVSLAELTEQWELRAFAPEAAATQAQRDLEQARFLTLGGVPDEYLAALLVADGRTRLPRTYDRGGAFGPSGWNCAQGGEEIRDAYASGMPAHWPDQMADRGEKWREGCVPRWNAGVTAEELARLQFFGMDGEPGIAAAYAGRDLLKVRDWIRAASDDKGFGQYLGRYLSHAGVGQYVGEGVPLQDVRLCYDLSEDPNNAVEPGLARRGLTRPDGTVEKGPDAIRELVDYAKAAGRSTDEAYEGIRLGISAKDVKAYGPKIEPAEIPAFADAGVPAKVARSLRARNRQLSPELAARLHDAGIVSGATYKEWERLATVREGGLGRPTTTRTDWDTVLPIAKAGVPHEVAQEMRGHGVPLESVAEMHGAGVTDIAAWSGTLHKRTQATMRMERRTQAAMTAISTFAKAGGTVEQLRRAQRAGIPLVAAHEHVSSTPQELWAAGAENRAAALAEEARQASMWGRDRSSGHGWDVTGPEDL
ncbi:hypothetical protein [Cellulosimicrobium sp. Marseille-Q4280]|uniref:hypothetical protein n=1 Tax=Cellulosimicrobium sp. Marseille-Q4280 TaxID=2937992 RepID=UPI00203E7E2F|nr:hypothetical protein [Cellulosimicrobium sp. Marseille-Q4280]